MYHHSSSISDAAHTSQDNITQYSKPYSFYLCWISARIYDAYCENPSSDAEEFSQKFHKIMEIEEYTPGVLSNYEVVYTSVFCMH